MEISPEIIAYIVSVILGVVSLVAGDKYLKYKTKALKFASALKVTVDAVEDEKVTEEEAKNIISKWKSVFEEARELVK